MRTDLKKDGRVEQMADLLGITRSAVCGCLYAVWAYVDDQTEDGSLSRWTLKTVDREAEHEGFAAALVEVGWLEVTDDGIRIIHFEEHNGMSAKRRASEAARKGSVRKKKRKASASNADTLRTLCGTRVRVREREEVCTDVQTPPLPPQGGGEHPSSGINSSERFEADPIASRLLAALPERFRTNRTTFTTEVALAIRDRGVDEDTLQESLTAYYASPAGSGDRARHPPRFVREQGWLEPREAWQHGSDRSGENYRSPADIRRAAQAAKEYPED